MTMHSRLNCSQGETGCGICKPEKSHSKELIDRVFAFASAVAHISFSRLPGLEAQALLMEKFEELKKWIDEVYCKDRMLGVLKNKSRSVHTCEYTGVADECAGRLVKELLEDIEKAE